MAEVPMWLEDDGLHMAVPADLLPPEALGRLIEMWQAEIRKSPLGQDQSAIEPTRRQARCGGWLFWRAAAKG